MMFQMNKCVASVDFTESGSGPLVVLVHSSMSGARQWSSLVPELEDTSLIRSINLFGYGTTPAWSAAMPPFLDDYADLIADAVPATADRIALVGHSLGGAVAMWAAAHQLRGRVDSLVLIEPSLFYLLDQCDRWEAFHEVSCLAESTMRCIANGRPRAAAERFTDYWCGAGTWAASSPERKARLTELTTVLPSEWAAVLDGDMALDELVTALPASTLVLSSGRTTRPSRELVELLYDARPDWEYTTICDAGHMAPLTHPQVVNPIIQHFLACQRRSAASARIPLPQSRSEATDPAASGAMRRVPSAAIACPVDSAAPA
jgi:pimeloyl-ACP methyl ester carboxylesterase